MYEENSRSACLSLLRQGSIKLFEIRRETKGVYMRILILLSTIFLSACSAKLVHKNFKDRTGIVSFLNQGASTVIDARRRDAEEKMRQFCKSDYAILAETNKSRFAGTVSNLSASTDYYGNTSFNGSSTQLYANHLYIFFECK